MAQPGEWPPQHFSGHLNFKNILLHIQATLPAASQMERVLLSGTSAGGAGAYRRAGPRAARERTIIVRHPSIWRGARMILGAFQRALLLQARLASTSLEPHQWLDG